MKYSVVIIVILILILLDKYYTYHRSKIINNLPSFTGTLKPGDILLCSTNYKYLLCNIPSYYLFNVTQFLFTNFITTHIGVVINYKGELYTLHLTSDIKYDHYKKKYVFLENVLTPLDDFIQTYPGNIMVMKNTQLDTEKFNRYLLEKHKNQSKKLIISVSRWFIDGVLKTRFFQNSQNMTCYEYIYSLISDYTGKDINPTCINSVQFHDYLLTLGYLKPQLLNNNYSKGWHI